LVKGKELQGSGSDEREKEGKYTLERGIDVTGTFKNYLR